MCELEEQVLSKKQSNFCGFSIWICQIQMLAFTPARHLTLAHTSWLLPYKRFCDAALYYENFGVAWSLPNSPLEVKYPRGLKKFLVCFQHGIHITCSFLHSPMLPELTFFVFNCFLLNYSAIEDKKVEVKSFTEIMFYNDNQDNACNHFITE